MQDIDCSLHRNSVQASSESHTGGASRQRRGLQMVSTSLGETVHSFLVGARYNRHCLDSQAFQKYGLFISRNHPRISFLTPCKTDHQKKHYQRQNVDAKVTDNWTSESTKYT
ncbi:hypothetical protein FKM82_004075 [Ascaphus truei]